MPTEEHRCEDYPQISCAEAARREYIDLPAEQWCATCRERLEQPTLELMSPARGTDK